MVRDRTVWSHVNKSIPSDNLPIEHIPNLIPYSQNATTILGELSMWKIFITIAPGKRY